MIPLMIPLGDNLGWLFGIAVGAATIVFVIANTTETIREPFDLAETQELILDYIQQEYLLLHQSFLYSNELFPE